MLRLNWSDWRWLLLLISNVELWLWNWIITAKSYWWFSKNRSNLLWALSSSYSIDVLSSSG
jgi:hypothetical protein